MFLLFIARGLSCHGNESTLLPSTGLAWAVYQAAEDRLMPRYSDSPPRSTAPPLDRYSTAGDSGATVDTRLWVKTLNCPFFSAEGITTDAWNTASHLLSHAHYLSVIHTSPGHQPPPNSCLIMNVLRWCIQVQLTPVGKVQMFMSRAAKVLMEKKQNHIHWRPD